MIESRPARNAAGSSTIEFRQLAVEPAFELRVERRTPVRVRGHLGRASPAPAPDEYGDHRRRGEKADDRQQPREPVEALAWRRRQNLVAELGDELVPDLRLGGAGGDPPRQVGLDLPRGGRVGLVERGLASRADELALEIGERRAGRCRPGQSKGDDGYRQESQAASTSWTQASKRSRFSSRWTPAWSRSHTSFPLRPTKNVSGTPVTP